MHDFGEKTVLGHKIPAGGGEEDGLKVIDILAHHPSTAKFISLGLARHFVADHPPQALVDRMAQTFMKTDGDLRAVMETMFRSPEFFSEGAWEARVKSPLEMAASTIRAMGGEMTDAWSTVQRISDMGQALYAKMEPTGYPDVAETWLGATAVIARMNFGAAVASGEVPGVSVDTSRWQGMDNASIAKALLGHDASKQTLEAIATGLEGKNAFARRGGFVGAGFARFRKEVGPVLTRRVFLRGSAIAMVGMGQAPMWLARAAAAEGRKRKTLVAIFMRGAADGLNIVAPFGDPRYREVRPTLGLQPPRPQDENQNNGPFGSVIDLDGKFGLHAGIAAFQRALG